MTDKKQIDPWLREQIKNAIKIIDEVKNGKHANKWVNYYITKEIALATTSQITSHEISTHNSMPIALRYKYIYIINRMNIDLYNIIS